jgi:hypothetical protein
MSLKFCQILVMVAFSSNFQGLNVSKTQIRSDQSKENILLLLLSLSLSMISITTTPLTDQDQKDLNHDSYSTTTN